MPEHNDDAVLQALARVEHKVDIVDGKLESVRGEVGHIRERTAVVESQLGTLQTGITDLSGRVRDLETNRPTREAMSELKGQVTQISDELEDVKSSRSKAVGIWVGVSAAAGVIGYILNLVITSIRG